MKTLPTFTAIIYVGFWDKDNDLRFNKVTAENICQDYCNNVGLCVTITETNFIYTDGHELGIAIGLINYPRFPSTLENIKAHAINIAKLLLKAYNQYKVSIVCSDETIMIEREDL